MKKIFCHNLLALTIIATILFAGCQKNSTTLRLHAAHFGGNGKVYIDDRLPSWSVGDSVWCDDADDDNQLATVSSVSSDGTATISVLSVNDGYRLIYPYSIVTSVNGFQATLNIPKVQRYYEDEVSGQQVVNAPMAAFTNGSSVRFHNLGALIAINICNNTPYPNLVIDKVVVSSASENLPLWGTATADDISSDVPTYRCDANSVPSGEDPFTISLIKYDDDDTPMPIYTFTTNTGNDSYKKVFVYVPDHGSVNNRYKIEIVARSSSSVDVNNPDVIRTETQESPRGGNLERNQMASLVYDMREVIAPTGAIPVSKFTVNASGDQVYFSAGNLQYQAGSSNIWRIAPNQYDFIGNGGSFTNVNYGDNTQISSSYTGWIDLFGWATSDYQNTSTGATRYHPYDFSKDDTGNGNNYYGYGPSINLEGAGVLTGAFKNYDWGVYHSNVADNDGNAILKYGDVSVTRGANWRTLTTDEWGYVVGYTTSTNPTSDNVRFVNNGYGQHYCWDAVAIVEGSTATFGILIYPDGYTQQIRPISSTPYEININDFPEGCAFLPVTGYRNIVGSNKRIDNQSYGYYWSSNGNTGNSGKQAYSFKFNINTSAAAINGPATAFFRYYGCAVRLVTPVQ